LTAQHARYYTVRVQLPTVVARGGREADEGVGMRRGHLGRAWSSATAAETVLVATVLVSSTLAWGAVTPAPAAAAGPHVANVTGTVALDGTPVVVRLSKAGQNGLFTFSASAGQRVSVVVGKSTVGPVCPALLVSLVRPDSSPLGAPASTCTGKAFLDTQTLDATGTWTILLDPQGSDTGHLSLQAYAVTDQAATIARNGVAVPVTITTPGQNARFTFSSVTGQQVSAALANVTFGTPCGAATLSLIRPNGSAFGGVAQTCHAGAFLDTQTLDADGNWTILVDPQGPAVGTANLQAFNTNDDTGLTHLDGSAFAIGPLDPGQNATIHFSGTTGQLVSALITNATFTGCPAFALSLVRPDGTAFGNTVTSCTATAFLDSQVLDQTGTWNVVVDPRGATTGGATLQTWDASFAVHPITLNGAPVHVDLVPGQVGTYTFTGTVGQQVSAVISGSTIAGCPAYSLSLVRPDGTTLGTPVSGCADTAFLDSLTLDRNGTWGFVVDPTGANSGTATINGYTFADDNGAAVLTGKPAYLDFNKPGQNASWTFAGTTGEKVSAYVTDSTLTDCAFTLSLVRPDGTTLGSPVNSCAATAFLETQTLDRNGTWTALVDPTGTNVGSATLQVFDVVDTVMPFKPGPSLKTFTALAPGTRALYRINGKAGDVRTVQITGSTFGGCPSIVVSLERPDGSVLASSSTCTKSLTLQSITLDVTGSWTLLIDPQGPATGTMIIRLL